MKVIKLNWEKTIPIRHIVLWPNETPEFCKVEGDEDASHFGVMIDNELVCVASVYLDSYKTDSRKRARLRKFATLPAFQGNGVGSFMLEYIIETLKKKKINYFWFDARESALSFYNRFGFTATGECFYKKEVPYYKMHADL